MYASLALTGCSILHVHVAYPAIRLVLVDHTTFIYMRLIIKVLIYFITIIHMHHHWSYLEY